MGKLRLHNTGVRLFRLLGSHLGRLEYCNGEKEDLEKYASHLRKDGYLPRGGSHTGSLSRDITLSLNQKVKCQLWLGRTSVNSPVLETGAADILALG
jgi:hypothetical protein